MTPSLEPAANLASIDGSNGHQQPRVIKPEVVLSKHGAIKIARNLIREYQLTLFCNSGTLFGEYSVSLTFHPPVIAK